MVLRFLLKLVLVCLGIFLFLGLAPIQPDLDVHSFVPKPVPEYLGPLTKNNDLNSVEILFLNQLQGPESLALGKDNLLYTGLRDSRIVSINPSTGKINTVVRIGGKQCDADPKKITCGRPLGLRFDSQGYLIVADHLKGIYKVNVTTGEVRSLVKNTDVVNGKQILFADDVAITKTGDIYFTDFGTIYPMDYLVLEVVEHAPHGRVLRYDAKTKETTVVIDNLYMPNGIQLTPQEDALIICQTLESNLLKYHLKGPKKGQLETFSNNLPGYPDNLRLSPRNTYWVALVMSRTPTKVLFIDRLAACPIARKAFYRAMFYLYSTINYFGKLTSFEIFHLASRDVERCIEATVKNKDYHLIVEVDLNGQIIRSLHSPDGSRGDYSEVHEQKNVLYFGSPYNNYLGKLKL